MNDIQNLYEKIGEKAYRLKIPFPEIPEYISSNLRYVFFDWQQKALENFLTNEAIKNIENPNSPTHLMFNMATGPGKTLIVASMILYYYKKGYRYFIFFVNQNNIVDKTENNFINSSHTKYLFKENIVIDDQRVSIKKVDTFSGNPQGIEIKFTSIQKLYNDIHLQKENQTTLDDLNSKSIIMLADEAHHLNTDTNRIALDQSYLIETELTERAGKEEIERKGWEHTVIQLILNKNGNKVENKNVLLEFTATIPDTQSIAQKYQEKIIYKFGLKEFLQAGYTKEINLVSSTLNKKERILQALLFQWYRHKIALKYNISNFKPVILFRSKTIEESKTDYEAFLNWIDELSGKDFNFLKEISDKILQSTNPYEQGYSRTKQVIDFINKNQIQMSDIANWIKQSYQKRNTIITNSETNKTKTEQTDAETEERYLTDDYAVAQNHRIATKDLLPKVYGGFGTSVSAYGFDAGIQFAYQLGGQIYDSGYQRLMHSGLSSSAGMHWHKDIYNAWTPANTNTDVPRLNANDRYASSTSTRFLTSSDYLSLNSVTLGYTVPVQKLASVDISRLRIYVVAENVGILTSRKGLDPRQSYISATTALYTPIRSVSGGVSLTF